MVAILSGEPLVNRQTLTFSSAVSTNTNADDSRLFGSNGNVFICQSRTGSDERVELDFAV